MPFTIRRIEYFYTTVKDRPGEAYKLLNQMAGMGINQMAFSAIPIGPNSTQLAVFPDDPARLTQEAKIAGISIDGPYHATLIQGDDELGALARIHQRLYEEKINITASSGVSNGRGGYGYLIYVKDADFEQAAKALDL